MYQPEIERISEELYFIAASPATRRLAHASGTALTGPMYRCWLPEKREAGRRPLPGSSTPCRFVRASSSCGSSARCSPPTCWRMNYSGYEHTATNGRPESTPGKFEQCAKGTILLDEFDAMPNAVQRRLLKVLETGEIRPLRRSESDPSRCAYYCCHVGRSGAGCSGTKNPGRAFLSV